MLLVCRQRYEKEHDTIALLDFKRVNSLCCLQQQETKGGGGMGAGEQEEELPPEAVAALKEYHELM